MSETQINIKTADGTCDCYTYGVPGDAPAPAVIFYMDGLGIRPELRAMARRKRRSRIPGGRAPRPGLECGTCATRGEVIWQQRSAVPLCLLRRATPRP
jgi:hypothetical protein